jgi:hypothetical protein
MHYSINPAEIKTEVENLGHTVSKIWNIKRNRTKLPLSMPFYSSNLPRTTKTYSLSNISSNAKSNLKLRSTNGILINAQTAKYMGTQKNTAISNHDASNEQVITSHSTVTERNVRMMSEVFSVVATILLTNYKGCMLYKELQQNPTHISVPNKDMLKQLFQQMGTMINLLTTVLTKLK